MNLLRTILNFLGINRNQRKDPPNQDNIQTKTKKAKIIDPHLVFTLYVEGNDGYNFDCSMNGSVSVTGESTYTKTITNQTVQGVEPVISIEFTDPNWPTDKNRPDMSYSLDLTLTALTSPHTGSGPTFSPLQDSGSAPVNPNA